MTEYGILDIFLVFGAICVVMILTVITIAVISLFIIFIFNFCMKIEEKYEDFLNRLFS